MKEKTVKKIWGLLSLAVILLLIALAGSLASIALGPGTIPPPTETRVTYLDKRGDQELAYLLVRLELKTRAVIANHYTRHQSSFPGTDLIYKKWLAKNMILPAAVADQIFSDVVPGVTGERAWVKMVVDEPRNPHNRGDSIALELLREIQNGTPSTDRSSPEAYYYAEPIKASATCLPCHGEPEGEPDPTFPQFKKDGWHVGDIIGAVVARVAPEE